MPIISATPIETNQYRITTTLGNGLLDNVVVTSEGIYDVYYIKNGEAINRTGRILNVVQNRSIPKNSYILFDYSCDNSNRRERIHFYQVQIIKDVTPNDAYKIAVDHGFVGTVSDWLLSLKGDPGKSNYEIAVDCGFEGTEEEWLESIQGIPGYSAYDIAVNNGFKGTEEEWLKSLKGKDAYEIAVEEGFEGTKTEWLLSLKGEAGDSAYQIAVNLGFEGTQEEWLESLRGQSAYEYAVANGFEGTEEEWYIKNGDVTIVNQKVEQIVNAIQWLTEM